MFYSTLITVSYKFCLSGLAKSVPNYVLAVATGSMHADINQREERQLLYI